jgi:hypothetical protein
MRFESLVHFVKDIILSSSDHFTATDITHFRSNVHHNPRSFDLGRCESKFGTLIRSTTASSDRFRSRGLSKKIGIGKRCTNGIGVRISMAENENLLQ